MKVIVFVKGDKATEAGVMPTRDELAEMGKFNEELVKAGVMLSGEGLHPTSKGKRVRFEAKKSSVVDGPFTETKEIVAGFWVWKVKSMEEAVEWIRRAPFRDAELELRPIFEDEAFGDEYTPELRARDAKLRAEIERQQQNR